MSNKNKNLYLNVSSTEMIQAAADSKYYAKEESCGDATSCNEKGSGEDTDTHYKDIFELAITNGDADTKYSCTGTLKVTSSGTMTTENPGDVTIGLKGYSDSEDSQTLDLVALITSSNEKTYNIKYDITGNATKKIQAYVMLENRDDDQNYLADKTLNITIAAESVDCQIVQPGPGA